jgi:hypothetical protein
MAEDSIVLRSPRLGSTQNDIAWKAALSRIATVNTID